jgi:glutamyl-tRNA synthetase
MYKVRFAPSPTGLMHLGNLRTAIFNWLFAKKNNGKFFIRIEDTDEKRSLPEYEEAIFSTLKWMNLDFDLFNEKILKQSARFTIYQEKASFLFHNNYAYYCQCVEMIDQNKCACRDKNLNAGVLRFKTPMENSTSFTDSTFGFINKANRDIEDFALLRSDGSPTYMLAVVIDDIEMEITNVIRGEDHLTNTFKQILIYQALNIMHPQFTHLPLIKGKDNKKLSKRNGDVSIEFYKNKGFLPEAMFNILIKLGWGYKNEELISVSRALEIFDLKDIRKSPTLFDIDKFRKFNNFYLKTQDKREELIEYIKKHHEIDMTHYVNVLYDEIVLRSMTLEECYENLKFLAHFQINEELLPNINKSLLLNIIKMLENFEDLSEDYKIIEELILNYFNNNAESFQNSNLKDLLAHLRYCIFSSNYSFNLFKAMSVMNKNHIISRIKMYIEAIK